MDDLYWLSDEDWDKIESHLPHGRPGAPRVDDRRVISGILHVLRAAAGAMRRPHSGRARRSTIATPSGRVRACGGACSMA